jgi:DNA polymerase-3 subunit epsilon
MIKRLFKSVHPLEKLEIQRHQFVKRDDIDPDVRSYFSHPIPAPSCSLDDLSLIVLDFETTGLDPNCDHILSVGLIALNRQVLSLSTAEHYYMLSPQTIKAETAVINHIVPETLCGGLEPDPFIHKVLSSLEGKIVVAHCTTVEKNFLEKALNLPHDTHLPLVWVDTLVLESSLFVNKNNFLADYRLSKIRERKGLPPYSAHNAFADAVATGELLLVLLQEIFSEKMPTLGEVYIRSVK